MTKIAMTKREQAWREGFEHAVRGGMEANGKMSMFSARRWRPIETAPKAGVFLVYASDDKYGKPYASGNSNVSIMVKRERASIVDGSFSYDSSKPTYWMPIPDGPEDAQ